MSQSPLHPLKLWRESFDPPVSQSELARRIGVSRSLINKVEFGERVIGPAMLTAFCRATGLPAGMLRPDLAKVFRQRRRA